MSPAQDVSCAEHLDSSGDMQQTKNAHADRHNEAVNASGMSSPTKHLDSPCDVQQTGNAHADSPSEAPIVTGMSSPAKPQSTAITKPNSTGIVLTKGSVCVLCSPITLAASQSNNNEAQTLTQCGSSLDGSGNQVLQPLSSSPTHCVDLDSTLVPVECKCDPGGHRDCVSRKEYASLLHQVEVLEKALEHQINQGHNSLLPCHGSHDSPSDVEDSKAKDSVLGLVPECSPYHCHSPFLDPLSMAISQGDSGYQSPVDVNTPTEEGNPVTLSQVERSLVTNLQVWVRMSTQGSVTVQVSSTRPVHPSP